MSDINIVSDGLFTDVSMYCMQMFIYRYVLLLPDHLLSFFSNAGILCNKSVLGRYTQLVMFSFLLARTVMNGYSFHNVY